MGGVSLSGELLPLYAILVLVAVQYTAWALLVSTYANSIDAALRYAYGGVLLLAVISLGPHYFLQGIGGWKAEFAEQLRCLSPIPAVMQLLGHFSFADGKVEAAKAMHPRLVDPENFFQVYEALPFEADRKKLRELPDPEPLVSFPDAIRTRKRPGGHAEAISAMTGDVKALLAATGFPGMRVLQFAFGDEDSLFLPHHHTPNSVVYTGTHDNDTTRGWWETLDEPTRAKVRDYLGTDGREIEWDLIRAAYASVAERAVVPMQDVAGLGSEARMNFPGRMEGNWAWRARPEHFSEASAARLRRLVALTGRLPARDHPS